MTILGFYTNAYIQGFLACAIAFIAGEIYTQWKKLKETQ
jgi:hypothetical protein